jgi:hypothetical protein
MSWQHAGRESSLRSGQFVFSEVTKLAKAPERRLRRQARCYDVESGQMQDVTSYCVTGVITAPEHRRESSSYRRHPVSALLIQLADIVRQGLCPAAHVHHALHPRPARSSASMAYRGSRSPAWH